MPECCVRIKILRYLILLDPCVNDTERDKTVIILGDSMTKHVNGWGMAEKVKTCNIYVKSFPGAKVRCLKNHAKPPLRQNPDDFVVHVDTNDLD